MHNDNNVTAHWRTSVNKSRV